MPAESGLIIRRHERHELGLAAEVTLEGASAEHVRFSSASGATDHVRAVVADLGEGGMGLRTTVFVPRRCLLRVRVRGEGAPGVALEATVRVQRVAMTDRAPTYLLGCSFVGADEAVRRAVARLLESAGGAARGAKEASC